MENTVIKTRNFFKAKIVLIFGYNGIPYKGL